MPDPLYSGRWTQLYTITPNPGGQLILDGVVQDGTISKPRYVSGFMVTANGTVTVLPKESPTSQTLTVVSGTKYDIAISSLLAVSGTGTVVGGR